MALGALLLATATSGGQLKRFTLDTPRALSGAVSRGVAVLSDGTLQPLRPLQAAATFDEPLGLALAVAGDGTAFVGTGHPARVYSVGAAGKTLLAELPADQVTALLLEPEGHVLAATAAPAGLYRLRSGSRSPELLATLAEGNIWDLVRFDGQVLAAAGNPGRLLRLQGTSLVPVATVPDRHARCLEVAGDALLVGTSGRGLVLRWARDGSLGVLFDSEFTEIADLAVAPDGMAYAAGLTGDPTLGKPPAKGEGEATVTTQESVPPTPTTDKGPATSEIVRVFPSGAALAVHRFTRQIAGALTWDGQGLLVGTGIEGELWRLVDTVPAMLDAVEASQVSRISPDGDTVLTTGPVRLLRRRGGAAGTFTSPPLDAGQPARWGEVELRGELPSPETCSLRFRSGSVAEPDDTWSAWSPGVPCTGGRVGAPPGRFLQWRVELAAAGAGVPRIGRVVVAYQQHNLPPVIKELVTYPPGEVFLKAPPPADKVVEVQHPDLSGIFTTLDDDKEEAQTLGRKYYRVGVQSFSWKAEDPNGDPLLFDVEVLRSGSSTWWKLRERLEAVVLAFDAQALADGLYRVRLTASDAPANPEAPATAQALSSWFVVDGTPPRVTVTRQGQLFEVTVEDELSPLGRVEANRDAVRWETLEPADGLLDGRLERFRIPVQPGRHLLTVRAVDDHHNRSVVAVEEQE